MGTAARLILAAGATFALAGSVVTVLEMAGSAESGGTTTGRATGHLPGGPVEPPGAGARVPDCKMRDLAPALRWMRTPAGGLHGQITVTNRSQVPCSVNRKPQFKPLRARDGAPLPVEHLVTLEARDNFPLLAPGRSALADVHWASWCGAGVSRVFLIEDVRVRATGPASPKCVPGAPTNTSSDWFQQVPQGY